MHTVFVYEFITGGGWWHLDAARPPDGSLLREGRAMARAVVADFLALPNVRVVTTLDARLREGDAAPFRADLPDPLVSLVRSACEERETLTRLAQDADWTLIVAPEFDGHLLERCQAVERAGGRLLGPGSACVALAADKHATAETLHAQGIPVPEGIALGRGETIPKDFPRPAVLKPRDGAGSTGVQLLSGDGPGNQEAPRVAPFHARLERFCAGQAVSAAWLSGPTGDWPLAPCRQCLSEDGRFSYLGGSWPLEPELAERAVALSRRVIERLPDRRGYLGLDLVLGDDPSGADDVLIEINPRLTTSYCGLRAAAKTNLAGAMLDAASGSAPAISFALDPLAFAADGTVNKGSRDAMVTR